MTQQCTYIGPTGTRCTCTKNALAGKNYCEDHYGLIYQKGTALRKRHKDIRVANEVRLWESLMDEAVAELEAEGFDFTGNADFEPDNLTL